jgi:hypothetical protein
MLQQGHENGARDTGSHLVFRSGSRPRLEDRHPVRTTDFPSVVMCSGRARSSRMRGIGRQACGDQRETKPFRAKTKPIRQVAGCERKVLAGKSPRRIPKTNVALDNVARFSKRSHAEDGGRAQGAIRTWVSNLVQDIGGARDTLGSRDALGLGANLFVNFENNFLGRKVVAAWDVRLSRIGRARRKNENQHILLAEELCEWGGIGH